MFAKKSLGQNFLKSKKVLADIVKAGNIVVGETVLEVGPGTGSLTEALLSSGAKVIAIEKDRRLIPVLEEKFAEEIKTGNLKLIEADILKLELISLNLTGGNYKLIANIPYYITGILIRKFLEGNNNPSQIVLMLQKEVAERIVAKDGKESLLSLGVKAYGTPRYVGTIGKGNFSPAPKVDSAIISIEKISRNNFQTESEENKFFELAKKAFGQKRKMVAGTLGLPAGLLKSCNLNEKIRPEELSVESWLCLVRKF